MRTYLLFFILLLIIPLSTWSQLFFDDFGTSFGSIDGIKWDCKSASPSNNSSFGQCLGAGDYGAYLNNLQYLTTESITVPSTGYTLTFQSSFNNSSGFPEVQVATGGAFCWSAMSWVTLYTISQSPVCEDICISLDAYAGQTIYIKFLAGSSFTSWYIDEVLVDNGSCGGGGSGSNYKWADNFNDNDLILDYTGNDGDEDCPSCGPWVLGPLASLELPPTSGWNGSSNKTEAFPGNMANVYYVKLDRNEFLESPTLDMSSMESVKISFHAKESALGSGGGDSWSFSDQLKLQIWDGSSWITVDGSIKDRIDAALPLNYVCFSAYKTPSSPGNHYYSTSPNVNAAYFHSTFKFRIIFEGGFSGNPFAWIDDVTFRADGDGYSTMVPCGISFWNEPDALGHGQDPGTTGNNNSEKGVELELDNSIGIPPIWSTEADDGDTITQVFGGGESERLAFAVISEHEIDFGYGKLQFYAPDIGWNSSVMSKDNNYTGPGWRYYAVEYISCDLAGGTIAEPTDDFQYYFHFDYGLSGFSDVYYHLNTSGIETGGGATSTFEAFNGPGVLSSDDCGAIFPLDEMNLTVMAVENELKIEWDGIESCSSYQVQKSEDQISYFPVSGDFEALTGQKMVFYDALPSDQTEDYYRIKGRNISGEVLYSKSVEFRMLDNTVTGFSWFQKGPKSGEFLVEGGESGNYIVSIYSIRGKTIEEYRGNFPGGKSRIIVDNLLIDRGFYYASLVINGRRQILKLMVR